MFGKKKQRIDDLCQACAYAKLEVDEAEESYIAVRSEIVSIAHEIEYVDEELYKRLFKAERMIDATSDSLAKAWATLAIASGSTNE